MLSGVDRVQVVVADRNATATAYKRLLDAEAVREDRVGTLKAWRSILQLGVSQVELLEPDGAGPVADFLARTKGGLFAVGFATKDVAKLRAHTLSRAATAVQEGTQLFVSPEILHVPGLRVVISPETEQRPAGLIRNLFETTLLVPAVTPAVSRVANVFALDASHFTPIHSEEYGYDGVLTLFNPDRLDRVEIVTPSDPTKTMGRFFAKRGPSLYMCFAEADDLGLIRERLRAYAPSNWTDVSAPPHLFIHPKALGGVMLGISRATAAWMWSGHPERMVAREGE